MKIKTILVDDEHLNNKNLEILLKNHCPSVSVLGSFLNVLDAKNYLEKHEVDLVLLDVSMPNKSGFDLLDYFTDRKFTVIFVTAHEEFAIKALRIGALDYVLKPILISELKTAIASVEKQLFSNDSNVGSNKIIISNDEGKSIIDISEILYFKGDDNICTLFLSKNRKISVSKTLKYFEDLLDVNFVRIHKSYLLNANCASKIIHKEVPFIELLNGTQLPISRRNLTKVNTLFTN